MMCITFPCLSCEEAAVEEAGSISVVSVSRDSSCSEGNPISDICSPMLRAQDCWEPYKEMPACLRVGLFS